MKKLSVIIACLTFGLLSLNVQAHGFQHNRFGSYVGIGFSNSFFFPSYSPYYYPPTSLIGGISYRNYNRNYNSRVGLQNRTHSGRISGRNNGRFSTNRIYHNGFQNEYRSGYSNEFTNASRSRRDRVRVSNNYRSDGYRRYGSSCIEGYYDRYGNYAERSLPASACRR